MCQVTPLRDGSMDEAEARMENVSQLHLDRIWGLLQLGVWVAPSRLGDRQWIDFGPCQTKDGTAAKSHTLIELTLVYRFASKTPDWLIA